MEQDYVSWSSLNKTNKPSVDVDRLKPVMMNWAKQPATEKVVSFEKNMIFSADDIILKRLATSQIRVTYLHQKKKNQITDIIAV